MSNEERFNLITRNLSEILTEEELKALIESDTPLKHYIGFEISGKVHLGTGLTCLLKVRDLHDAGAETIIFLADWHGWINNKLDGTLETSQRMARLYFEEAMKAAYLCIGGDPSTLHFVQGSELYKEKPDFWANTLKVAKCTTISRMMRSTDIMGKMAGGSSSAASLFYPAMQAADIYTLGVNISHSGSDQRNAHVVARDAAKNVGAKKPIAIHHHLLKGLLKPPVWPLPTQAREELVTSLKMSKSKPDSAVFIHDSPGEIKRKVNNAFAPESEIKYNPILDWVQHLVFYNANTIFTIRRQEKWGGDITYNSYADLEKDYADKKVHPQDLKKAMSEWLIATLEPARKYFEDPRRKAALDEIEQLTAS